MGARIAFRRRELGLSQTNLGQAVGITFQQVQKYERGTNRVSASRLYEMSKVLNVTCGWLMGEDARQVETISAALMRHHGNCWWHGGGSASGIGAPCSL
ncbi:transcriptional regulator, Cro/CI family [Brevundimonas abyssalis TAR-001]|uniref:Transcriptional regulator, Cro/CI family n=1 Tax=Brevundimonas abyssalis TAR-001 TaxID=1391729 RepID=A0A8E0KJC5_9CAUL|nr:transcriptional regulator, Cro/CI family [Brevundimonas abyssalis TAR-001]